MVGQLNCRFSFVLTCTSVKYSPQDGHCPNGYILNENSIGLAQTDCDGNIDGSCVMDKSDAAIFCNSNDCNIISETNNHDWLVSHPEEAILISIGTDTTTKIDSEWNSCVKSNNHIK